MAGVARWHGLPTYPMRRNADIQPSGITGHVVFDSRRRKGARANLEAGVIGADGVSGLLFGFM